MIDWHFYAVHLILGATRLSVNGKHQWYLMVLVVIVVKVVIATSQDRTEIR